MMSNTYSNNLKDLVQEGKVPEKIVDESVMRVLELKNNLGLFENLYGHMDFQIEKKFIMCKENLECEKELATETFVLLKNENKTLPLNKMNSKVALIGPYADNIAILGEWSMFSEKSNILTLKEAFENKIGKENVLFSKGSEILREKDINEILLVNGVKTIHIENEREKEEKYIKEAVETAKKSDKIILAIGEHYRQTGEACSRANIEIPQIQKNLLNELAKLNKPIIAIVFNGRPLVLKEIAEKVNALLEVWFPGTEGANAIVDVILGDVNPSGKLTMSFPQATGQCPIYYNHYNTGRPHIGNLKYVSRYQDIPTESYYPFGYGLSYSNFVYSNLELSSKNMKNGSKITVTVTVKNESENPGKEVIQLYIQDLFASVVRPVKELKAFKKKYFSAFEEKKIEFEITEEMLKFWNEKLEYKIEDGEFKVFVGGNSRDTIEERFKYED